MYDVVLAFSVFVGSLGRKDTYIESWHSNILKNKWLSTLASAVSHHTSRFSDIKCPRKCPRKLGEVKVNAYMWLWLLGCGQLLEGRTAWMLCCHWEHFPTPLGSLLIVCCSTGFRNQWILWMKQCYVDIEQWCWLVNAHNTLYSSPRCWQTVY